MINTENEAYVKIAVLVSGGVDSSVSLALLKKKGYDLHAFYLKIWLEDELAYLGSCPWEEDLLYAEKVCKQYGVPLTVVPFQKEYWQSVVTTTIESIKAGRTPNPDILCNKEVKFGLFFDYLANQHHHKFTHVASGHYAQIVQNTDGTVKLLSGVDLIKDQTYFLSYLQQNQLQRLIFPIGSMSKEKVRKVAEDLAIPAKNRPDSQGICFLGKIKFKDFVKHHVGEKVGDLIEEESGLKVGTHKGFWFYTVGQRTGIGLSGGPWYVVKKDSNSNFVFISKNYYDTKKRRNKFIVESLNWFSGKSPQKENLQVKMRHGEKKYECVYQEVQKNDLNKDGKLISQSYGAVELMERDQGIAPGQYAVFYDGMNCLGAGIITNQSVDSK